MFSLLARIDSLNTGSKRRMSQVLATSPIVNPGNGMSPSRFVLSLIRRDGNPVEFVVQKQYFYEDGSSSLGNGNWMPIFSRDLEEVRSWAWRVFKERSDIDSHYPLADLDADPARFGDHLASLTINTGKG